ncbi:MAG: MarR family transcriptional regulator [Deltaproteobacteria bacterium]|nr:MarR family transcriptional regulator [Deltaproteobacteria bacterium]MBW2414482.1 MarR family transcriptional regulator [Deltaproteobacteria bacterium]
MDAGSRREFERRKQASTGQLLLRAARLLNERAVGRVRDEGQPDLRPVHLALMPHLDMEGTRATVLAARMGITKQGVSQIVADLEQMGIVERRPDPGDGRARLVCFTRRGEASLLHGLGVLERLESELAVGVGETRMQRLRQGLVALLVELEKPA